MRVTMLAGFAGPVVDWPTGSVQDLDDAEAIRMIEAGFALPVATVKAETATLKPSREKR